MASLPDVIRSGLREEDLTDLPPEIRKGLEPLLRYVNNAVQGFTAAFSGQIDSKNVQCEVQTVNLSHGVPQTISLKRLAQAKGIDCISVGSADGKTRHALALPVVMTGTTTPNSVRVTAYFVDPSAVRVPVTIRLWPDGQYSAIAPTVGNPILNVNTTAGGSIASGSATIVKYTATAKDSDTAYSASTGQFTVPAGKGGDYAIAAMATWSAAVSSTPIISIYVAGSEKCAQQYGAAIVSMQVGAVLQLNAGDTVDIRVTQSSGVGVTLQTFATQNYLTLKRLS